jgi:hypothetical protein
MMANLICRRLEKGDEPMLSRLFKEVFDKEINIQYWEWKYFQNPAGEHMMYVAIEPIESKIVGEIGTIPIKTQIQGKDTLATQVVDIVILPKYQKRGPFFQLERLSREENIKRLILMSYAVSIKRTYKISTKVLKFKGVSPIMRHTKIIDPGPFIYKKIKVRPLANLLGGIGRFFMRSMQRLKDHKMVSKKYEFEDIRHFDSRFDEFWKRESQNYEIIIVRDSEYLNWRYIRNPIENYKIFCVKDTGTIRGFIVLNIFEQEGIRRGRIADIFIEKHNTDVYNTLLNKALDYFFSERVAIVSTWAGDEWFSSMFEKSGFSKGETPHDLIVRSYDDDIKYDYIADRKNWYLTMGDSDYF